MTPPVEQSSIRAALDDLYINSVVRNGLEKSIARFSLQQRAIDDGHSVSLTPVVLSQIAAEEPQRYELLVEIGAALREIGNAIDVDNSQAIADVPLRLEDDLKEAARIDRLEAPTPSQRAKAAKIRLVHGFPGVDFNLFDTVYHATRKYNKLAKGVELHGNLLYRDLVFAHQKQRNLSVLQESIFATHHLSAQVQKVELMLSVGILDLLTGEYCKESPELIALQAKCVFFAKKFERYFGLNININQDSTEVFGKLLRKLGLRTIFQRKGTERRLRYYRVATLDSIESEIEFQVERAEKLKELLERREEKLARLQSQHQARIDRYAKTQTRNQLRSKQANYRLEVRQHNIVTWSQVKLDKQELRLARLQARIERFETIVIPRLLQLCTETNVRQLLFDGVIRRLEAASTSPINSLDNGVVDVSSKARVEQLDPERKYTDLDRDIGKLAS
ncbi:MAG: hypothetical protein HC778_00140 [Chamaesiphon sp. CSU_1_12]|nr:hypothetical protein [Chamaesiphon sp. CSU_1_12]